MATATQTPEVTIYANAADPLTPVVVQYMNEHSGCSVTTKYIDQDASDGSDDTEEGGKCLGYPRIHVGNKYFGGVGCLDKFPLRVTEHRLKEITGEVDEPMCREQKEFDRLILFNGKHEHEWADMWTLYKKELANFWVVNEIDLQDDLPAARALVTRGGGANGAVVAVAWVSVTVDGGSTGASGVMPPFAKGALLTIFYPIAGEKPYQWHHGIIELYGQAPSK
eukprot:g16359.t1